jgi:hypothetical protein
MNKDTFQIGAPGVDTRKIVAEIKAEVARKREQQLYSDPRVARAERTNLANLKDEEDFMGFYLECLRDAVFVDISDFEIVERRARFAPLLRALKRTIWQLLKFYTYRLWSQQNQVNGLLLSVVETMESRYRDKIRQLEDRIARLEPGNPPPHAHD